MLRGIYAAALTMDIAFKKLDITAENISNAHTYGYKKKTYATHAFKDMMVQLANGEMAPLSMGLKLENSDINKTQGIMRPTGNPLDLAIQGEDGFFQVEYLNPRTNENSYEITRNGRFTVDAEGYLKTFSNAYVMDVNNARIKLPTSSDLKGSRSNVHSHIMIGQDGTIYSQTQQGKQEVAKIKVVSWDEAKPDNPLDLAELISKYGLDSPTFDKADLNALDVTGFKVKQGFLEESNVNLVTEMVMFMMSSKNYGMSEKMIQTMDKVMDKSINEMGRMQ